MLSLLVRPVVAWLWVGAGIMAAGTALAAWPARRKVPQQTGERDDAARARPAPRPSAAVCTSSEEP